MQGQSDIRVGANTYVHDLVYAINVALLSTTTGGCYHTATDIPVEVV